MNRKIVMIGAFLILGMLLVASCLPTESSTTPTPSPTPTPTPTPTPSPVPTPTPTPTPSGAELPPSSYLPTIPRISVEEVKAKLDAGSNIVIIDSRSEEFYDRSHIVGAISFPLDDMAEPYDSLDGYDEIITYCHCPDEQYSARAVRELMLAGFSNAKAIEGGLEAWKEAGFPVAGTDHGNQ